jgi:NADH-quinone oxidoreductase subunit K
VAFNQLYPNSIQGQIFALFVIVVAVCEAAVGLAIVISVYKYFQTPVPDEISELKE